MAGQWYEWESTVGDKFALLADICNLGSGFLATDYMSFLQSPGTQGQNMRQTGSVIYRKV